MQAVLSCNSNGTICVSTYSAPGEDNGREEGMACMMSSKPSKGPTSLGAVWDLFTNVHMYAVSKLVLQIIHCPSGVKFLHVAMAYIIQENRS